MGGFLDGLDAMLGAVAPVEVEPVVVKAVESTIPSPPPDFSESEVEEEPVPEVARDAFGIEIPVVVDPFAAILDAAIGSEALKQKPVGPDGPNYVSEHDWVSQREVMFAGEPYEFRCSKCLRWVKVPRDQSLNMAVQVQGIQTNCSLEVVGQIMTS